MSSITDKSIIGPERWEQINKILPLISRQRQDEVCPKITEPIVAYPYDIGRITKIVALIVEKTKDLTSEENFFSYV